MQVMDNAIKVVLSDAIFNGDILDETKTYSQLVWIPRFAYKITSGWYSKTTGTDNKGTDGVTYIGGGMFAFGSTSSNTVTNLDFRVAVAVI